MKKTTTNAFFGIMLLGAIWGVLEASMGNILHWIGLHPYTGLVMTSIGLGLMSIARKTYGRRWSGIAMGAIAAGFKAFDFLIPGSNVIRPMVAIILTAIAFEAMALVLEKTKEKNLNNAIAGVAAGYASIAAFAYVTAYAMRFSYWLDKGALGILKYLAAEGWMFGLGGAAGVWTGYRGGTWANEHLNRFLKTKKFSYIASIGTAACLAITIIV